MANKRIISFQVVESDKFTEMKCATQLLYFHFVMHADNDGFVTNPTFLIKSLALTRSNLSELVDNDYVLLFKKEKLVLIRHWFVHNPSKFIYHADLQFPTIAEKIYLTKDAIYTTESCYGIVNLKELKEMRKVRKGLSAKRIVAEIAESMESEKSLQIRKDVDKKLDDDADIESDVEVEVDAPQGDCSEYVLFTALRDGRELRLFASLGGDSGGEQILTFRESAVNEQGAPGEERIMSAECIARVPSEPGVSGVPGEPGVFGAGNIESAQGMAVVSSSESAANSESAASAEHAAVCEKSESEDATEVIEDTVNEIAPPVSLALSIDPSRRPSLVKLSAAQVDGIISLIGMENYLYYVERLSNFIYEKDASIKNHYATILKWAREDGKIDA